MMIHKVLDSVVIIGEAGHRVCVRDPMNACIERE